MKISDPKKGIFPIGVVAEMIGVSQKQLRLYETRGIINPARSNGNRRLYSEEDLGLLTYVHFLVSIRRVNLTGIKIILEIIELLPKEKRDRLIRSVEEKVARLTGSEKHAFEHETPTGAEQPARTENMEKN